MNAITIITTSIITVVGTWWGSCGISKYRKAFPKMEGFFYARPFREAEE